MIFVRKHNAAGIWLGELYSMKPDGSDVQRLTNFSESYAGIELPQLSQDGTKLSFISNYESWKSTNYIDAFLADLSSGTITRITGHEKRTPTNSTGTVYVQVNDPKGFALTPSAIRISYKGCENFVTGNSATLTVPANEEIWIKAEVAKAKGDYKVISVPAGGNSNISLDLTQGTLSAESCSPSFNGEYLAVSENSETVSNNQGETFAWYKILLWDTNTRTEIAEVGGMKQGGDITPAFSPNNAFLAFGTGEQAINSIGVVLTEHITQSPNLIAYGNILGYHAYCTNPAWSPNGQEIAYVYVIITTSFYGIEIQSNIYKVSSTGGSPKQLTFYSGKDVASKPSFSPDGSKIVFTHSTSNGDIFTLSDYISGNYKSNIYTVSSNGGSETAITTDGNSLDASWGVVNGAVDVDEVKSERTVKFLLEQNYPNPFNPSTKISWQSPVSSWQTLKVYDVLGNEVATLVNEYKPAGEYEVEFSGHSDEGRNLSSGVYFYQLNVGGPETSSPQGQAGQGIVQTKKMVLTK